MGFIRVLEHPSRCMQRLGYIKYVLSRGAATSTSSLEKLGHELVKTARFDIAHYEPFLDALCGSREYQQSPAMSRRRERHEQYRSGTKDCPDERPTPWPVHQ